MTLSALLTCAFCAARCACLNRRTRCSGVSPGILEAFGAAEVADFDVAWGMVDVNLVASLTLRGPILDAILEKEFGRRRKRNNCQDFGRVDFE